MDKRVPDIEDAGRTLFEKICAALKRELPVAPERFPGESAGTIHVLLRAAPEFWVKFETGGWIGGSEFATRSENLRPANQHLTCEFHVHHPVRCKAASVALIRYTRCAFRLNTFARSSGPNSSRAWATAATQVS